MSSLLNRVLVFHAVGSREIQRWGEVGKDMRFDLAGFSPPGTGGMKPLFAHQQFNGTDRNLVGRGIG